MNATALKTKSFLPFAALAFFLSGALLQSNFTSTGLREGYRTGNIDGTSSAVALSHAAGEFRVVAANVLWLDIVDHYHHQYMAQGHSWTTDVELLPMLNLIVTLDPHFTQAYEVSSSILMHCHRIPEAAAMLDKGANNNPQSWEMPYDAAMMHAWYLKDPNAALPFAIKSESLTTDPFYKKMVGHLISTLKRDSALIAAQSK